MGVVYLRSAFIGLGVVFASLVSSCVTASRFFDERGFHDPVFPYDVLFDGPETGKILGPEWRLENYLLDPQGVALRPKDGSGYESEIWLDPDGDGKDQLLGTRPTYTLRLEHRKTGGLIWLSVVPVSSSVGERDLRVLMDASVASMAGTGYFSFSISRGRINLQQRTYAATIVDSGALTVDGMPAFAATIEVANVDQLRLSPQSRSARTRIILARPSSSWSRWGWGSTFPTLMVIGYTNGPVDFEPLLGDFQRFVNLIHSRRVAPRRAPRAKASWRRSAPKSVYEFHE